ncbi:putative POM121-like protein 1-like [Lutra lutra]|uniref:putative POM121-like protein 1-like n=1 Tax=Lutra lutra TaxID=9657 RepID=UPI001FD2F797|nr:putative POM121-like protein 1-like [Lutra lutra]
MLSAFGSQVSCRRRCESIVDTVTPCVLQKWVVTGLPPSAPRNVHDISKGERVCRDPRKSGKGIAQLKGDPALREGQETHRKDPKGTGTPQGAFRPLVVHGGLSSFMPRPGPLLRALPREESSEDPCNKKSPSSHRSSCPTRNAITSSYSSTRGCHPVQRRRGLATSQASWPPRSPKKVSQESPLCPARVPALCQKKNQLEKDADTTTGQTATQRNCSSPGDCSRPQKRKVRLLPQRRGEPLRLPSPPELGFRVTTEDLDREKRAALQRIQDALRGDTEATCSCGPSLPSSALALSAAVAAPLPASDIQVTCMDCSPSSQPLLLGSHPGCSGSNFASIQALSMLSRGSMALVTVPPGLPVQPGGGGNPGSTAQAPLGAVGTQASTLHSSPQHGQPAAQAPDPLRALSTALAQLSLGSGTQASTLHSSPAWTAGSSGSRPTPGPEHSSSPAVLGHGTQASTLHSSPRHGQPAAQAPDPLRALSTALAQLSLGSSTQAGYVVPLPASASWGTRASAQPGSATSSAYSPLRAAAPGLAAAPQVPGTVSHAGPNSQQPRPQVAAQCRPPSAWGFQQHPQHHSRNEQGPKWPAGSRLSLGPNTVGRPCQSTLSGTAGASTTNHPLSGAPSAPHFSHIPRHLTKRRSSSDGCSTASKAACGGGGVLASPPSGPASLGHPLGLALDPKWLHLNPDRKPSMSQVQARPKPPAPLPPGVPFLTLADEAGSALGPRPETSPACPNLTSTSGLKILRRTPSTPSTPSHSLNSALGKLPCTGVSGWAAPSQRVIRVAATCPEREKARSQNGQGSLQFCQMSASSHERSTKIDADLGRMLASIEQKSPGELTSGGKPPGQRNHCAT